MLAVSKYIESIAASGNGSFVYGPIQSGTRTLLMHMSASYGTNASTSGVTMSFQVSPMNSAGTGANGYVASNVKSVTALPAANGIADAEAVFALGDNPYALDSEVAYITVTLTNNDSVHAASVWVGAEDERSMGH